MTISVLWGKESPKQLRLDVSRVTPFLAGSIQWGAIFDESPSHESVLSGALPLSQGDFEGRTSSSTSLPAGKKPELKSPRPTLQEQFNLKLHHRRPQTVGGFKKCFERPMFRWKNIKQLAMNARYQQNLVIK